MLSGIGQAKPAPPCGRLHRTELEPVGGPEQLLLDADDALVEVDRSPAQAEHFTAAQTVQQQQGERRRAILPEFQVYQRPRPVLLCP